MTLDMGPIKEKHGLAQARRESERADPMAARVGTKLFRDGHRKGFWDGAQYVLENLAAFADVIDWRILAGMNQGYLPARWLRLGDRVVVADVEGLVITKAGRLPETVIHFTVRTDAGAQVVFERTPDFLVRVLAVGPSA